MDKFPFYLFAAAVLHVTEEFFLPGGFLNWVKKNAPSVRRRINAKLAVIINTLFLLLCLSAVFLGGHYPFFALSIAGLLLVNGTAHLTGSIAKRSYSPGLITSLLFYIPLPVYIFISFNLSTAEIVKIILFGVLYHLAVPVFLFAPFNKTRTGLQ